MIKSIESSFSLQLSRLTNLTSSEKIEKIQYFNTTYDNFLKFAKSHFLSSLEFN
ncbi:MAG: hypothetical protein K2L48_03830 [Mycoplasmoidaceae bacterium]|nr:hypothetical protein [Mycoplasmoidaceae bacterium]